MSETCRRASPLAEPSRRGLFCTCAKMVVKIRYRRTRKLASYAHLQSVMLDDYEIEGRPPTLIKLDIEGVEELDVEAAARAFSRGGSMSLTSCWN